MSCSSENLSPTWVIIKTVPKKKKDSLKCRHTVIPCKLDGKKVSKREVLNSF